VASACERKKKERKKERKKKKMLRHLVMWPVPAKEYTSGHIIDIQGHIRDILGC
jgi:hypothetical protein